jgi:hypothetical protein
MNRPSGSPTVMEQRKFEPNGEPNPWIVPGVRPGVEPESMRDRLALDQRGDNDLLATQFLTRLAQVTDAEALGRNP